MREKAEGNLHGIKISRNALAISHLMYADDLLVMCRENEQEARVVNNCMERYFG